ncbi:hypothetical protein EZS27_044344, partial [termite gut metagenome]
VKDVGIVFIIIAKTSAIEVCRSDSRKSTVHHHYLGMMKSSVIQIYLCTSFHQFVNDIKRSFRRKRYIRFGRKQNFYMNAAVNGSIQFFFYRPDRQKIGIDYLHGFLCGMYGADVCMAYESGGYLGSTVTSI